jgi:hypothetical protein
MSHVQALHEAVGARLPEGTQLLGAFQVMDGPSPGSEALWGPFMFIPVLRRKWFVVAVTADATHVFASSSKAEVRDLVASWPGHDALGTPTDGMKPTIQIAGRRFHVYLRWSDEARRISRIVQGGSTG